jgi:GNAT superfamily N-acetyltransferase
MITAFKSKFDIVKVSIEYLDTLLDMGRAMHEESVYSEMDFNAEKISKLVIDSSEEDSSIYFRACIDGQNYPFGFMVGCVSETWFGKDKEGCEMCIYVDPDMRHTGAAVSMIKDFVKWCESKGAYSVDIGSLGGMVDGRYYHLLSKLGFGQIGFIVKKVLKGS